MNDRMSVREIIFVVVTLTVAFGLLACVNLTLDATVRIDINDSCYYEETTDNHLLAPDTIKVVKVCEERSPA